jgi:replicative DNA helicase
MTDILSSSMGAASAAPLPPQAVEAERSVLAALMMDHEAVGRAVEQIDAPVFYRTAHQKIFGAIVALYNRNEKADLVTLAEELRKKGELELIGGPAALTQIAEYGVTAANLDQHIKILREKAVLRSLINAAREIQQESFAAADETAEILDRAEQRIFEITDDRVRQGFVSMKELMLPTVHHVQELKDRNKGQKVFITGVASGFPDIDAKTAGFQRGDLVIIAGRPSMGKCLAEDSELVLDDGSVVTIADVYRRRDSRVGTLRDHMKLDRAMPSDYVDDGVKPVFEVRTRLGRRVETTLPHPFLTLDGWKALSELRVGDHVAVPRRLPVFGTSPMRECEIKLLASAGVTTTQVAIEHSERPSRAAAVGLLEPETETLTPAAKDIPASVFCLPREQLAMFLRHLFAIDGWATVLASGQPQVGYSSTSERLARQVTHLLLRFGVIAKLQERGPSWRIDIRDSVSLTTFVSEIGIFGKEAAVARVREAVAAHGSSLEDRILASSDVYWDRIESITPAGLRRVYDLTIPGTHNFVANDVCVHNTSFALNVAENAAIHDKRHVAILSLEMSKEQLALRLLCSQTEIPLYRVRSGNLSDAEFQRIPKKLSDLYNASIMIDDTAAPTVLEIRAKCRRLRSEGRLDMVMIDYLQLIRSSGHQENRVQEISQISRSLKALAKELDVPVIALSQLSRAVEQRTGKDRRPQLSDLRESGALEQDADLVMFVFREEMYNRTDPKLRGKAEILIAKQRNGPVGDVPLTFRHEFTQFVPYAPMDEGETAPAYDDFAP